MKTFAQFVVNEGFLTSLVKVLLPKPARKKRPTTVMGVVKHELGKSVKRVIRGAITGK